MYFGGSELQYGNPIDEEGDVSDSYESIVRDGHEDDDELRELRWWAPSSLLTSGTSAISAFTLAVAGVMGFVGYPVAEALVGFRDGPSGMRERAAVSAMVVLLFLLGTFWLSQRVLLDDDDEVPAWARHLAGSSVVIAAIGTVLSLVTIVASLSASSQSFPRMGL